MNNTDRRTSGYMIELLKHSLTLEMGVLMIILFSAVAISYSIDFNKLYFMEWFAVAIFYVLVAVPVIYLVKGIVWNIRRQKHWQNSITSEDHPD